MQKLGPRLLLALALLLAAVPTAAAQRVEPRIINGDPTTADGQYPWTVALVSPTASATKRAFCGGTLIAPKLVLTAAHCTIGSTATSIDVVVGDHDLTSVDEANRFDVDRISLHPLAQGDDDDIVPRRDVSLLQLDADEALATAQPVDLAGVAATDSASEFTITGWGLTESSEDTVKVMEHAEVDRVADASCETIFESIIGELVFSPLDQICAIRDPAPPGGADLVDSCNGDSGGPLVWDSTGTSTATDSAGWLLVGVTSWGLGCAARLDDGTPVPGVYARASGTQLRPYVLDGIAANGVDLADVQPEHVSGTPVLAAPGDGSIFCQGNPLTWSGDPDEVEQLIRRQLASGGFETVSFTGFYVLDDGDYGDRFVCEVHARRSGAGGYGLARSAAVRVQDAPVVQPTLVEVPVPVPVPVPGDPVFVPVPQPRVEDDTDPRVSRVRRSCTRRRICTFTIAATDTGTGVKTVAVTLNTVRTRSCRRNGRRTICASWRPTTLRARKVAGTASTFRVTTRRLTRGTHVLHARAIDAAGNIQSTPRAVSFRLR